MRRILALVAAAAVAAVGAVILGEYAIAGVVGLGAGLVFGLLVAEAAVGVGGAGSVALALGSALASGTGMVWAAWISTGRDLDRLAPEGWVAVALAAAGAAVRARPPRPAPGSQEPSTPPA